MTTKQPNEKLLYFYPVDGNGKAPANLDEYAVFTSEAAFKKYLKEELGLNSIDGDRVYICSAKSFKTIKVGDITLTNEKS